MTLNLNILETITETAKTKAANQAAWVRAIDKAAEQLITNPYICEKDGGLLILSYSNETYHANGACQCKAYASGRPCWHRAAAQLMKRYNEAVAAQVVAPAPVAVATDERATLIADIKAAWHCARPFEAIGYSLHRLFGVTRLEDVNTADLRQVLAALTPIARRQSSPPAARPIIAYRHVLDACAAGNNSQMAIRGAMVRAGRNRRRARA